MTLDLPILKEMWNKTVKTDFNYKMYKYQKRISKIVHSQSAVKCFIQNVGKFIVSLQKSGEIE